MVAFLGPTWFHDPLFALLTVQAGEFVLFLIFSFLNLPPPCIVCRSGTYTHRSLQCVHARNVYPSVFASMPRGYYLISCHFWAHLFMNGCRCAQLSTAVAVSPFFFWADLIANAWSAKQLWIVLSQCILPISRVIIAASWLSHVAPLYVCVSLWIHNRIF